MTKNTAIVVMNIAGLSACLAVIFAALYIAVNYTLWGLLLMFIVGGIKFPSSQGLK